MKTEIYNPTERVKKANTLHNPEQNRQKTGAKN